MNNFPSSWGDWGLIILACYALSHISYSIWKGIEKEKEKRDEMSDLKATITELKNQIEQLKKDGQKPPE